MLTSFMLVAHTEVEIQLVCLHHELRRSRVLAMGDAQREYRHVWWPISHYYSTKRPRDSSERAGALRYV